MQTQVQLPVSSNTHTHLPVSSGTTYVLLNEDHTPQEVEKILSKRKLAWASFSEAQHFITHRLGSAQMKTELRRAVKCKVMHGDRVYRFTNKEKFRQEGAFFQRHDILIVTPA